MSDIRGALRSARARLASLVQGNAVLEAELLLAETLGKPRVFLTTWPETRLETGQLARFEGLLQRRLGGEPMAYILGHREFWSLDLRVSRDVLIPRPETELLVELALDAFDADTAIRVADLGTGSGAIAAALARERPKWRIVATDLSGAALDTARENFQRLGLTQVETRRGAWCEALGDGEQLQLLLSNPPYVADTDPHLERGDPRFEPRSALAAGPDGLDAIRCIVAQAPTHLSAGGGLMLEHGWDQGAAVRRLLQESGFVDVRTHRDLAGHERASTARLRGEARGRAKSG